jgi:alpha-1,2-mannosyltransferase
VNLDLKLANSLEPSNYPRFTLIFQALASIRVTILALSQAPCDVLVDTMGVGYSYPFLKLMYGVKIYSYTHYPIVSSDMLNDV